MHYQLSLWRSWAAGEITDDAAQAAAAAYAAKRLEQAPDRPQPSPAGISGRLRGHAPREKMFGPGRCVPLDRNAKCRVMMLARALSRRQEKGKAYGEITAKFVAVLQALLWGFHNAASGKCFPSYEAIAEAAACSRTTVYHAIRALEQVGLLSWVNRLVRVREWVPGLFGKGSAWRWRVVRTSNAYVITDPLASEFNSRPGTSVQAKDQTTFAIAEPSDGRRALTNLGITPPDRVPGTSERKRWPITAPDSAMPS